MLIFRLSDGIGSEEPGQKLDSGCAVVTNWISFQLAIIAHPLGVICCDITPEAKIIVKVDHFLYIKYQRNYYGW